MSHTVTHSSRHRRRWRNERPFRRNTLEPKKSHTHLRRRYSVPQRASSDQFQYLIRIYQIDADDRRSHHPRNIRFTIEAALLRQKTTVDCEDQTTQKTESRSFT
ncbi:hypothetical protein Rs2_30878 [Raphanus sativus]|nr:hypothetical protein Rs2_30878 [Raphanus sativus]